MVELISEGKCSAQLSDMLQRLHECNDDAVAEEGGLC
jgi:hypothetical protein